MVHFLLEIVIYRDKKMHRHHLRLVQNIAVNFKSVEHSPMVINRYKVLGESENPMSYLWLWLLRLRTSGHRDHVCKEEQDKGK